jgi:hypothetical protein
MRTFTARQAAQRLRVHRTTILYWRSHGWLDTNGQRHHLTPVGTDPLTGATLFDWDELLNAERDTRRKSQRSHRASRKLVTA